MSQPDFNKLNAATRELERLADAGKLTREDYTRLSSAASDAVGENTQLLEGVIMTGMEHGFVSVNVNGRG